MDKSRPIRVVPSGKVYRQKFDAEVQLVKALEKRGEKTEDSISNQQPTGAVGDDSIPVVRDVTGVSFLSERQQTWAESFPNEEFIQNPVLYKHYKEELEAQYREPEGSVASKEVQGLPDVLTPAKTGSDIIERIAQSRKERHEAAIEDMYQELGVISSELEPRIVEAGEALIATLLENDKEIERLMARIQQDEDLLTYSKDNLHALWDEIAAQSEVRQSGINKMDDTLTRAEADRMQLIREVFQNYAATLEKIAHMMQPDLQRLLDQESQTVNQQALSNRRAYADLYARLMMADIEREKSNHSQWKRRLDDWKRLHTQLAVQHFRDFMNSDRVINPDGAANVMSMMCAEQSSLNKKRSDLIHSLRDLKPPASTKTAVYQWNQQVTDLSRQIDALNQQYFNKLYAEYEHVCQLCLQEVDQVKKHLIDNGICTDAKATQVINEQCLPLVGDRQTAFEQALETMDKALEEHNKMMTTQLKSLFKFAQGAAHVWDVHELGLGKQERGLQEKLETCRHTHDSQNQDREANLDIIMDRMRQDASEQSLKESLRKALEMLDKIKEGYSVFHKEQLEIVASYPEMVQEELKNFDGAVCKFFEVDRIHPEDAQKEREKEKEEKTEEEGRSTPSSSRMKNKRKKRTKTGSRASSRTSDVDGGKVPSPLPLAVSEVLSTAKGTTFYVLTVAGEHGVPQEEKEEQKGGEEGNGTSTFLTEAEEVKEAKPTYIESVDIPGELLIDIKKVIRMNFLDHLEEWQDQAVHRARSVVAAKTEELNSELDLRLHLHQPRARRAELDVHNVRAAELVMHGERVTRHTKGINQALNELKHRFNNMTVEHNQLVEKFRQDIEALEVIFVNATKSSKLVALSNQLQVELDKFMTVIRASLRNFRQHLDDTLQMLRESNARFIKSFKVFSDGGNFCPEEIEEYRKRLEKMSHKVDSTEGFVMADLEGMESKRLEQATKISSEFEDRFKNHMFDLIFMEKIARWLTNTQVKIKAEVADSNAQAQRLVQLLNDLERRIDACQRPNLDKEQVTPTQLYESLKMIFESFHDRSLYLNCIKEPSRRPSSATLQGNPALGARVNFQQDVVPPISKPGKQPAEDPTVGVIKSILKTQKTKQKVSVDAESDGEPAQRLGTSSGAGDTDGMKSKNTSRPPTQQQDGKSTRSSRKGTATASVAESLPKRTQSGLRRISKGGKFDKKYMVFGEKEEEGEDSHILGKIRHVLRETLDGLLSAAELYYRQKGSRPVTRPQALQEYFDACAEVVVQKLQSYFIQADEYHNQCLQEFRGQLTRLEKLVTHIPGCVIQELLRMQVEAAHAERVQLDMAFEEKLRAWDATKSEHKSQLRPTLGHPQQIEELKSLGEKEAARREDYLKGVEEHTKILQNSAMKQGETFIEQLARTSEQLLVQFDNMLTVDDVERGRVPPKKHPTSELIRRKKGGEPLEDDDDKEMIPRGKNNWKGVPRNQLVAEDKPPTVKLTASVTTAKTTLGHHSTVEARDKTYEEYKERFLQTLDSIEEQKSKQIVAETRWTNSWVESVHKVKQLY